MTSQHVCLIRGEDIYWGFMNNVEERFFPLKLPPVSYNKSVYFIKKF